MELISNFFSTLVSREQNMALLPKFVYGSQEQNQPKRVEVTKYVVDSSSVQPSQPQVFKDVLNTTQERYAAQISDKAPEAVIEYLKQRTDQGVGEAQEVNIIPQPLGKQMSIHQAIAAITQSTESTTQSQYAHPEEIMTEEKQGITVVLSKNKTEPIKNNQKVIPEVRPTLLSQEEIERIRSIEKRWNKLTPLPGAFSRVRGYENGMVPSFPIKDEEPRWVAEIKDPVEREEIRELFEWLGRHARDPKWRQEIQKVEDERIEHILTHLPLDSPINREWLIKSEATWWLLDPGRNYVHFLATHNKSAQRIVEAETSEDGWKTLKEEVVMEANEILSARSNSPISPEWLMEHSEFAAFLTRGFGQYIAEHPEDAQRVMENEGEANIAYDNYKYYLELEGYSLPVYTYDTVGDHTIEEKAKEVIETRDIGGLTSSQLEEEMREIVGSKEPLFERKWRVPDLAITQEQFKEDLKVGRDDKDFLNRLFKKSAYIQIKDYLAYLDYYPEPTGISTSSGRVNLIA